MILLLCTVHVLSSLLLLFIFIISVSHLHFALVSFKSCFLSVVAATVDYAFLGADGVVAEQTLWLDLKFESFG